MGSDDIGLYSQLVRWYAAAKGGVQNFEAVDVRGDGLAPVSLELKVKEHRTIAGKDLALTRYGVSQGSNVGTILADSNGKIYLMQWNTADGTSLPFVREGYEALLSGQ